MKRIGLLAALCVASAVTASNAGAAAPSSQHCTGTIGNVTVTGNLIVPGGASCDLEGTIVTGGVAVFPGGNLISRGASIAGSLVAFRAASIAVVGGSSIAGSANIVGTTGVPSSFGVNAVCQATIGRSLTVVGNLAPVTVGVQPTPGPCGVSPTVGGNVAVVLNRAQILISNTSVHGDLYCFHNRPPASGAAGSNAVAGRKLGECAGL